MAYAIMRIEKRKDIGAVRRCADHHLRAVDTPNADPLGSIRVLAGSDDSRDVTALIRDSTRPLMRRRDAIRCLDVFCGASPEFFASGGSTREFEAIAVKWASETFGADNIVLAVTHEDELTPHVQMLVTPITPKGKLAASHWLDGPKKLEALQDSFAEAMQQLGLERGIKGSRARHEDVKRWYSQLKPMMQSAELRIAEAEKRIAAAGLAADDVAREKAAIDADRAEVNKLRNQMKRVEEFQQKQAKKIDAKELRVTTAEEAVRADIGKVREQDIALKNAQAQVQRERDLRHAAETKLARISVEKKVLEDDLNVTKNEVGSLRRRLRKSPD